VERNIVWSLPAVTDLENIRDYIARDSERYAFTFVEDMLTTSRPLSTLAERGRIVPEINRPSVRELLVKRHRLIYEVSPQQIDILAVIHMARDLSAILEKKS
jgi:toxin ParE1/3/4